MFLIKEAFGTLHVIYDKEYSETGKVKIVNVIIPKFNCPKSFAFQ